jgi:hypothetical protein
MLVAHGYLGGHRTPALGRALVRSARAHPGLWLGMTAALLIAGMHVAASGFDVAEWASADDAPAYAVFPKQILETGAFDQPFSFRRMSAYGGQSLLQALVLLRFGVEKLHLFDRGLCTLLALALVAGTNLRRFAAPRVLLVLPLLVIVTVENVRTNLASEMSGAVVFLAMYRTAVWRGSARGRRRTGAAILLALLGAGACTLRPTYGFVAVAMLGCLYGLELLGPARRWADRRPVLREAALVLGVAVVVLAPWAAASWWACRSVAYPYLSPGYHPVGFEAPKRALDLLLIYWQNVTHTLPIASIHVFVLGAWLVRGRSGPALRALLVASLLGFVALLYVCWAAYQNDYKRYYFGFELAFVAAACLAAFEEQTASAPRAVTWPAAIVALACLLQLYAALPGVQKDFAVFIESRLPEKLAQAQAEEALTPAGPDQETYRGVQASVPPDEPFLAMVDDPWRFDFRRNPVRILDLPGVVSPPPGMPRDDAAGLAAYLKSQGIYWVVYVRSDSSRHLYRRDVWQRHAVNKGLPQDTMAPAVIQVLTEFDTLAARHRHAFEAVGMVTLDLRPH